MRNGLSSYIMRTTVDIDEPILNEIRAMRKKEGKSLGRVISDLLVVGLSDRRPGLAPVRTRLMWVAKPLGARIDLADRDALYAAMDEDKA